MTKRFRGKLLGLEDEMIHDSHRMQGKEMIAKYLTLKMNKDVPSFEKCVALHYAGWLGETRHWWIEVPKTSFKPFLVATTRLRDRRKRDGMNAYPAPTIGQMLEIMKKGAVEISSSYDGWRVYHDQIMADMFDGWAEEPADALCNMLIKLCQDGSINKI